MTPFSFRSRTPHLAACTRWHLLTLLSALTLPPGAVAQDTGRTLQTLDEIDVHGTAPAGDVVQPTASRLTLSPAQTPASLDSIDAHAMQTRGLQSVESAVTRLPGVTSGGSPGNLSSLSMRGFTGDQITWLHNGLYLGPSSMTARPQNSFNLQAVEVLKGPASVLYGQGAIGGVVNVIDKQPRFGPDSVDLLAEVSRFGGRALGIGGGGQLGDALAYRADISRLSSDGFVHAAGSQVFNGSAAMLWRPSDALSLQLAIDYANDHPSTYFGTPLLPADAARAPLRGVLRSADGSVVDATQRNTNYNVVDAQISARHSWPQATLVWSPSTHITVRSLWFAFDASRRWINAESYAYDPASRQLDRDRFFVFHQQHLWGTQTSVRFDQPLGRLSNQLVIGLDYNRLHFVRERGFPDGDSVDPAVPGPSGVFGTLQPRRSPTQWSNTAVFLEDALDLDPQLKLVLGGRWEMLQLERRNFDAAGQFQPASSFSRSYRPNNLRVGLVYALSPSVTPYVSYTTGSDLPGSNILLVNAAEDFGMSRARQYEAGIKAARSDQRASATLALYDIRRENILTLTGQDMVSNVGAQTARGIELSLSAQPTAQWAVEANLAYTDARYHDFIDPASGLDVSGNRPANVPRTVFNLGSHLDDIAGLPLELGLDLHGVGARAGNLANSLQLERYLLTGVYANYRLNSSLTLGVRADNLFNTAYVQWADVSYPRQVLLGQPRSYALTLRAAF
ncbi:TonB-dependent receptor [Xanthomonas cucurbitae]|uniref:TonB-dependent receptor n=1 Tax=Xanthomonas cucurbitae TaxID=56453 RepID=A0ABY7YFF4_9XANT|nr:TonB-dependent receptor [Xanthomonas cucurbitae]WDM68763.1 TonB-dependent receptor [Xanthomonas cucurbitae]WDM72635.1 TonB-dependent receptor [Xanthomonas cucurbitae]